MIRAVRRARVLLDLAQYARSVAPGDPDAALLMRDAALVIGRHDDIDSWYELVCVLQHRDDVEDTVAVQNRTAELEVCDREVAAALWTLISSETPCPTCLDTLVGEPHMVAAATQPAGACQWHDRTAA